MPDRNLRYELRLDDRDNFIAAGFVGRKSGKSFTRELRASLADWPASVPTPHHSHIGFSLTVGYGGEMPDPIQDIVGECGGELRHMRAEVELLFSMLDSITAGTA